MLQSMRNDFHDRNFSRTVPSSNVTVRPAGPAAIVMFPCRSWRSGKVSGSERSMSARLAQHSSDHALGRPPEQVEDERATDTVAQDEELTDAQVVHHTEMVRLSRSRWFRPLAPRYRHSAIPLPGRQRVPQPVAPSLPPQECHSPQRPPHGETARYLLLTQRCGQLLRTFGEGSSARW